MNRHQFTYLLGSLVLAGLTYNVPALAQDKDDQPYKTQTFSGNNLNNVRVATSGGSIAVEGSSASGGVKVEMYVRPNNWNGGNNNLSKEEIEERLREYEVEMRTEGNTVIATAKRKSNDNVDWKRALSIGFKVYTPRNFTTDLKTSGGSIRIRNLNGEQNFATSGGSLDIDNVEGNVKGRTSGGSIRLTNCRKDMDVATSGGSIEATASNGTMKLRTSGGSVRLRDLKGKVDATTSGGSIQADGVDGELITGTSGGSIRLANISGSIDAHTNGGGMEVEITRLGSYVKLAANAGSLRVRMPLDKGIDLDVRGRKVSVPLNNFSGNTEEDRIQGKLNGGGIPVTIVANSGSVTINQN